MSCSLFCHWWSLTKFWGETFGDQKRYRLVCWDSIEQSPILSKFRLKKEDVSGPGADLRRWLGRVVANQSLANRSSRNSSVVMACSGHDEVETSLEGTQRFFQLFSSAAGLCLRELSYTWNFSPTSRRIRWTQALRSVFSWYDNIRTVFKNTKTKAKRICSELCQKWLGINGATLHNTQSGHLVVIVTSIRNGPIDSPGFSMLHLVWWADGKMFFIVCTVVIFQQGWRLQCFKVRLLSMFVDSKDLLPYIYYIPPWPRCLYWERLFLGMMHVAFTEWFYRRRWSLSLSLSLSLFDQLLKDCKASRVPIVNWPSQYFLTLYCSVMVTFGLQLFIFVHNLPLQ